MALLLYIGPIILAPLLYIHPATFLPLVTTATLLERML